MKKWIINHPYVIVSPITNKCVYINPHGKDNTYIPKLSLKMYIRELHNHMVQTFSQGGLSEESDKNNSIIICDSVLCYIIPPELKKIYLNQKVMCVGEVCISANIMYPYLIFWRKKHLK